MEEDTSTIQKQRGSRVHRIFERIKAQLSRPSLLSATSESCQGSSEIYADQLQQPGLTQDAIKLLGPGGRALRRQAAHRAESSRFAEVDQEEEQTRISRVVVDGDLGCMIEDDAQSVRTDCRSRDQNSSRSRSYQAGRTSRGTVSEHISRLPEWIRLTRDYLVYFFDMSFADRRKERSFKKEHYYSQRQMAIAAATFYLLVWALICALTPVPYTLYEYVAFLGVYGSAVIPILPMVLLNTPYRAPWLWQIWLLYATWALPDLGLIQLKICNYFDNSSECSNDTDFIFYAAAIGQATLSILALGQHRLVLLFGSIQFFCLSGGLFFNQGAPRTYYRDCVFAFVFHAFLLGLNFIVERSARQLFEMREQLKLQFTATQRAQVMEKKASDLTKRFVSYIFHEVRVPLNTALLSVQNLEGENLFDGFSEEQKEMVDGLTGSLSMMEKVLNDVLSFNRMETGTFTQAKAPFDLHKSIQLTAMSHTPPANMKHINLETDLDPKIDALKACFIGDEMRLRQITSNLVSNSIKFTQEGFVKITSRLVCANTGYTPILREPEVEKVENNNDSNGRDVEKGNVAFEKARNSGEMPPTHIKPRSAVVRIEVQDTGVGLRHRDLEDDRLFSPYVQTEIGRRQGGKGTGLGLALVRQIVQLSRGRLGIDSKYGEGTTIWFEIPYSLGEEIDNKEERIPSGRNSPRVHGSDSTAVDSSVSPAMSRAHSPDLMKTTSRDPEKASVSPHSPDITPAQLAPLITDTPQQISPIEQVEAEKEQSDKIETSPTTSVEPKSPHSASPKEDGEGLDVLVVDDDKLTRMMMSRMIKRLGHRVNTAENGQEALNIITDSFTLEERHLPVDVVFLDNQMPLMTGVEVAYNVRKLGCPVYIVGCTGNALKQDQDEYLDAGADRILTKPIKQAALQECIVEARKRKDGETTPKTWKGNHSNAPSR